MKRIHSILCAAGAAMTLVACNSVDFKKTSAGVPYKVFGGNGSKDSLPATGIIKFNVIQNVKAKEKGKDSVLFSSYREGRPQYIPVGQVLNGTARAYTDFEGNFAEIMRKARKGDSLYIVMAADSFLKTPSPMPMPFKNGDEIVTTIRIVEVFKTEAEAQEDQRKVMEPLMKKQQEEAAKAQAAEATLIQDYVQKNMPKATKTASGLYYEVLTEGQGANAAKGQQVEVKYRGTHLDGNKFDEGTYPLVLGSGGAVPGFEEAAGLLNKGRKIRVLIPSSLGYGPQGNGPIKPFEPLVFEMEAVNIGAAPAAPKINIAPDTTKR
jgi:FKBP-type peptidyl-prolyl cis-trans isomerase FkpA